MSPMRPLGARLSVSLLLLLLAGPCGADNIADLLGRLVLEGSNGAGTSVATSAKPSSMAFSPSFSPLARSSHQPSLCPISPALPGLAAFSLDAKEGAKRQGFQSPVMRSFSRGGPTGGHKKGQTLPYMGSSPKGATHKVNALPMRTHPAQQGPEMRAFPCAGVGVECQLRAAFGGKCAEGHSTPRRRQGDHGHRGPPRRMPPHPFPRQERTHGIRTGSFVNEHGTQNGKWRSCGGSFVDIPSVVSLRRYIAVPAPPRTSLPTAPVFDEDTSCCVLNRLRFLLP